MNRTVRTAFAAIAALTLSTSALPAQERPGTILVLDASGSMWGQIDGVNKITIAREVVADILADFPADQNLGLVAYGHRERGQCDDIELMVPPGPGTGSQIAGIVAGLNPRGMTPMADSIIAAAQALRYTEQAATVILVSDGIETCNPDPCAAARALAEAGVDFTAHVIGFDVTGEAEALLQMQCMAEATGGSFHTADTAAELTQALHEVVTAAPPEAKPAPEPEPEPAPEPQIGSATVSAPAQVVVGAPFRVTWEAEDVNPRDYVTVVPMGAEDGESGDYTRIQDNTEGTLRAPVEPGFYEVRLQTTGAGIVLARTPVEAVDVPVTVSAPAQVVVGAPFRVTWQADGLNPRDYVTIVPMGAEDGDSGDYTRLEGNSQGDLRAPVEPGMYEVRLQMTGAGRVLARTPVEVVDVKVTVSAPAQVVVGAPFRVTWEAEGLNPRDYVTIVPMGAEDGESGDYTRIQDSTEGTLRAPVIPGLYEVRLQMTGEGRVLARTQVEAVDVPVTVTAPAQAVVGSSFRVTWQAEGLNPRDYVTIVPMGAEDGDSGDYTRIEGNNQGDLRAPTTPGLYEVRLQMTGEGRVLARTPIEIIGGDVTIAGPQQVRAGAEMTVTWTGAVHPRDYVTVVPMGAEDGEYAGYLRVGDRSQDKLTAPEAPGVYELRYMLDAGGVVMARQTVEVLAADAPMDDGAGLVVPETARVGQTITVSWTGGADSADQRVTLARADQADFTWIVAESAIDRSAIKLEMPTEPGTYEVRYLDLAGGQVLGRAIIEVTP
ncbi:MAG: VWA domain-containing protein [Rubellimicrobium sp.]|nr:VWA domain-containing protein [Rubellimicrobium sp.]